MKFMLMLAVCVVMVNLAISGKKRSRDCGFLDDPSNGHVRWTFTLLNGVAMYSCDQHYLLEGNDKRTCRRNGKWSGSQPSCILNLTCPGDAIASAFNQVCCPSTCGGQCGGSNCSSLPGGAKDCCQLDILRANVSCKDSDAPCVLKPFPAQKQFLLDEIRDLETELDTLQNVVAQPIPVRSPFLAVSFIIATTGQFPNFRRKRQTAGTDESRFLGEIRMFGGNFAPSGWSFCDGSLMNIDENSSLFSIIGTKYGGNGINTFGLPDFRGQSPVMFGQGVGLTDIRAGEKGGNEEVTLGSS